jgi:hypothetical protein
MWWREGWFPVVRAAQEPLQDLGGFFVGAVDDGDGVGERGRGDGGAGGGEDAGLTVSVDSLAEVCLAAGVDVVAVDGEVTGSCSAQIGW